MIQCSHAFSDFQTHYYSTLCLNQLNRTIERQHLLQQFRQQAQILAQSNLPLMVDRILPSFANITALANQTGTPFGDHHYLLQSTLNITNQTNWTDPASSLFNRNELDQSNQMLSTLNSSNESYNQSVQNVINPSAANVSTLATTLASLIWSPEANRVLQNFTASALKLIFTDLNMSEDGICRRETSLLFLLLMLGTVWMAVSLFNFNKTYVCACYYFFFYSEYRTLQPILQYRMPARRDVSMVY